MDIAKCLSAVESLCTGEFPEAGHRTVELATSHGTRADDALNRELTAADFHACREALAQRLHDRWGRQHPCGQQTVRLRVARGEEIPEPWATLSLLTDELDVWQPTGTGRWLALGVADRDDTDEIRLLAAVTATPPP
ncbi:hypothetical protein BIV25_23410 [Streptomyces sp. MUSC 14]|uniref:hypothetical protein n=1 Tax=Streptomyces sp. MUSC 14 TaxID=1354889 RepID=UPI0008F590EC|nr:hypothetical protein [Streptomyces sp. MUSC 14]OIJ93682.1 hypothetical protein BIV25_23410 [Streptomyces sp. MUSC 14]